MRAWRALSFVCVASRAARWWLRVGRSRSW